MTKIKGGVGAGGFYTPVNRVCTCGVECNGPVGCYHDYEDDEDYADPVAFVNYDADFIGASEPQWDDDQRDYYHVPKLSDPDPTPPQTEEDRLRELLERVLGLARDDGMIDNLKQSWTCMEIEDLITKEL